MDKVTNCARPESSAKNRKWQEDETPETKSTGKSAGATQDSQIQKEVTNHNQRAAPGAETPNAP
jgi:hypothetical protein